MASTAENLGAEQYTVAGATGVDVALKIAGPGSRAYAFVIDWHIRILLALAWLVAAMLILTGALSVRNALQDSSSLLVLAGILPPNIIYFLYHPLLEALMHGQTPGKRMAGVRIVNRDGGIPSVGAILIRNAFRLIDSLPVLYLVGLVTCFFSAQRVRIGDMAAGTLLILDEAGSTKSLRNIAAATQRLDVATVELIEELLGRWSVLDINHRGAIARSLLKRVDANSDRLDIMSDGELHDRLKSLLL